MKKLKKREGLNLATHLTRVMVGSGLEKTSQELIFLLEGKEDKIGNNFKQILEKYGVNLEEVNLRGESLCENGKNSPLKVALQIFYASLHPKLKGKDLKLEDLDLNNNPDEIVNNIIRQGIKDLGIEKNFDDIQLEKIKTIGLEVLELISNHKDLKDILTCGDCIVSIRIYMENVEGLEILKLISNHKDLKDILGNEKLRDNLLKLGLGENGLEILKLISNREDLKSILSEEESIDYLLSLGQEPNGLEALKLISDHEDFVESLVNNFPGLIDLIKKDKGLDILATFANSPSLFFLLNDTIEEKYEEIQERVNLTYGDIKF